MDQESPSPSERKGIQSYQAKEARSSGKWTIPPLEELLEAESEDLETSDRSAGQSGELDHNASGDPSGLEAEICENKGQAIRRIMSPGSGMEQNTSMDCQSVEIVNEEDSGSRGFDLLKQGWVERNGRRIRYKIWELVGKHKRDILRTYVIQTRDDQQAAEDHFKDALSRLKEVYKFQTTPLETVYRDLMKNYRKCLKKAEMIARRIQQIKVIASDLFEEWEQEADWIQNEKLKQKSLVKLDQTRKKLEILTEALEQAEASMEPVLIQFYDQALYLKHNLNAQAVGVLKAEARSVEREIKKLVKQMNTAIKKADAFVEALP